MKTIDKDDMSVRAIIAAFEAQIEIQEKDARFGIGSIAVELRQQCDEFAESWGLERCPCCGYYEPEGRVQMRAIGLDDERMCNECYSVELAEREAHLTWRA